jgi:nitrogen regulatory protein PII
MKELNFSSLKKLEIILDGEHRGFATDLLDRAGVKGYTIVNNLSGKGAHGFHAGHLMFNEDDVLIMIIAAVREDLVEPILQGFAPFFNEHSGVVFVSDIQVTRMVKFGG